MLGGVDWDGAGWDVRRMLDAAGPAIGDDEALGACCDAEDCDEDDTGAADVAADLPKENPPKAFGGSALGASALGASLGGSAALLPNEKPPKAALGAAVSLAGSEVVAEDDEVPKENAAGLVGAGAEVLAGSAGLLPKANPPKGAELEALGAGSCDAEDVAGVDPNEKPLDPEPLLAPLLPKLKAAGLEVSAGVAEEEPKLKGFEELEGVADDVEPKENPEVEADATGAAGAAAVEPNENPEAAGADGAYRLVWSQDNHRPGSPSLIPSALAVLGSCPVSTALTSSKC